MTTVLLRLLGGLLRGVLLTLAALWLYFEEWGWRPLTAWAARLAQWPPLQRLEQRIRRAPPRLALVLFLAPALLLLPVKLLALYFIEAGRAALGISVIVAAKVLSTALVGRLFILTEAQLLQFPWFARALCWWRTTKARVREAVAASAAIRALRGSRRHWRLWLRRIRH